MLRRDNQTDANRSIAYFPRQGLPFGLGSGNSEETASLPLTRAKEMSPLPQYRLLSGSFFEWADTANRSVLSDCSLDIRRSDREVALSPLLCSISAFRVKSNKHRWTRRFLIKEKP